MESDTTPTGPVKPPPLNSDQLNYLIWRYLQESGYGDAAVKLQRDWKVEAESLPFAKHIKGSALISLVQKGLRYHHLSLTIDESGQQTKKLEPSMFFFGPDDVRFDTTARRPLIRSSDIPRVPSPMDTSSSVPKKRETDSNGTADLAGQTTKRSRKTTQASDRSGPGSRKPSAPPNYESPGSMEVDSINGQPVSRNARSPSAGEVLHNDNAPNGTSPNHQMELDIAHPSTNTNHAMTHENLNNSMPALVHTLTNGESIGIQVVPAKVANLGPSTVILSVPEKSPMTKAAWRPGDRSRLTASGHSFCGICHLSSPTSQTNGLRSPYQSLLTPEDANIVTAFAWASNGLLLAIATYAEQGGQIHIFDGSELALIETLPGSHRAITNLKWLPESTSLVGIVPGDDTDDTDRGTASILTWNISAMLQGQVTEPDTQQIPSAETLMDMDVAETRESGAVFAAGPTAIYRYPYRDGSIPTEDRKFKDSSRFPSPADHTDGWSFIRCPSRPWTAEIVVAASAESASIWLPLSNMYQSEAHTAPITGLEIRPRAFPEGDIITTTTFATSSIDGTIKIWHYHSQSDTLVSAHKLHIDRSSPIMAISYSPDGFCLAAASYDEVHIWNAEHGYNLMASWKGSHSEWEGSPLKEEEIKNGDTRSSVNGDGSSGVSEHGLAWDSDSKKLAFGLGSQVAIIDFQR